MRFPVRRILVNSSQENNDVFGMRGREIYHLPKLSIFRVHPDTFSDTGGRKLAAVGDFYRKMVISRQFKQNLRLLMLRYRVEILKEGKK